MGISQTYCSNHTPRILANATNENHLSHEMSMGEMPSYALKTIDIYKI